MLSIKHFRETEKSINAHRLAGKLLKGKSVKTLSMKFLLAILIVAASPLHLLYQNTHDGIPVIKAKSASAVADLPPRQQRRRASFLQS